jgi:hypothetical protein
MMRLAGATLVGLAAGSGFGGDVMERQFTMYNGVPVGEDALRHAGWHKHDEHGCDPHLGFGWTKSRSGATKGEPLIVYTTAGGQSAGVGTIIRGDAGEQFADEQQKWASSHHLVEPKNDPTVAHIDVAFRSGSIVCSGATGGDTVGDVITVNPAGRNSKSIPLTEAQSDREGWRRGSCFDGMGWHRFLDTSRQDGTLSGQSKNLFPVVAMYDQHGAINAIFFASRLNQVSIPVIASNGWEPKSLDNSEMCMNTCDGDACDFGETPDGVWSTMHIYLQDHKNAVCPKSLTCAISFPFRASCCDAQSAIQV